ncbi:MAG: hypothetical protein QF673_03470, partial [Candidatus Hydrothermarchaeota archaeon]|nr:hypothetical protein [Candidatus Hydrothermarchaeota archaeon]
NGGDNKRRCKKLYEFNDDDIQRTSEKLANIPQANLSQHLAMLRHRKVVSTRRKGVIIYYKITNSKIIKACDLMREVLFEQIEDSKKLAVRIASMKNE